MSESNRRQARIPDGAIVVENPVGTAPSYIVEVDDKAIISLPGVPREMDYLMQHRVLPYLSERMGESAVILSRWVHTVAIGESMVGEAISDLMHRGNPTAGTRAHPGQTDVCITAKASTRQEALRMLDAMEAEVRERLGTVVFGTDEQTLVGVVGAELQRRGLRLALVDAVTGGVVAAHLREAGYGGVLAEAHKVAKELEVPVGSSLAAELANELRSSTGAELGLALIEEGSDPLRVIAALVTSEGLEQHDWPSRGRSDYATQWVLHRVLDLVRRWLLSTEDRSSGRSVT
jgi:hypothetical protein